MRGVPSGKNGKLGLVRALLAAVMVTVAVNGTAATADAVTDAVQRTTLEGLQRVPARDWSRLHVQRVLQAFANGGQPSEAQLETWATMKPGSAIRQMLNFKPVNLRLSPHGAADPSRRRCDSLNELQEFWGSDHARNPMRMANRPYHATLDGDDETPAVSPLNLFLTWSRAMHTPGCNGFLHKTAFYLTNYHAAIHVQNAGPTLIRAYYDDVLAALAGGADFVELMTTAASHAALSRAYGHMENRFDAGGDFQGNDDFAREYFQLLFGIQGTTEDPVYHENVTIEHNAWLLTGMALDAERGAWGSASPNDWLLAPIDFSNHYDAAGRLLLNQGWHYDWWRGDDSCLEILHQPICGRTAREKLEALGPVAAAHPESMASTPLKFVRFFGDDILTPEETAALQTAWADADHDLLAFLRSYAVSTLFHDPATVKFRSAFDRNMVIHNANQLSMEEAYSELFVEGPAPRMYDQGALVFAPVRDVFGGQTGADAVGDRYLFKSAWDGNVNDPAFLGKAVERYRPGPEAAPVEWRKDWGAVIPADDAGEHTAGAVGAWLWNRFVGDGGVHYDLVAQAQVHAMLATGFDFGALMDPDEPGALYDSTDLVSGEAAAMNAQLAATVLDLHGVEGNERVGMVINFITALPYTFITGGTP